ncbi:DUF1574 domain-containing protein [Oscillatoria sp. FACHB-1407]|uniref:DUF1574 domain-containing protein n=1 Tax=Oscillatoria sp. FACHB-1407 TaxID=2692847 RepID=UPI0016839C41|nr:DUF1574 domain-containing protein [Oscillatoria sp. FACHB-1407]MBD2464504.1 DUF1574 domain-containing protein [Oscillatoria sp. FACHB-1407]
MLNSASEQSPSNDKSPLAQWLRRMLERGGIWVQFRIKGNHLHVLCESKPCLNRAIALNRLIPALYQTDINSFLPADHPPIYQVLLYGRTLGEERPAWSYRIHLDQLDRHLEQLKQYRANSRLALSTATRSTGTHTATIAPDAASVRTSDATGGAIVLSTRSQAKRGHPNAIARYLSERISTLGIAVRVSVKTLPFETTVPTPGLLNTVSVSRVSTRRLWIVCESLYSPDPVAIGEPMARQLRDLELDDFRDAVICIQVTGEAEPDWLLRVDLTPPVEMLRERARWGDVGAIARLLRHALSDRDIQLSTSTLRDATLHLSCCLNPRISTTEAPDQATVRAIIAPLLETLGPQGIQAATIYGQAIGEEAPAWIDWLNLPAAEHAALAEPTLTLAQQGDWDAIAFLLLCALNPDLDQQIATGGIRIQLLQREDLLHIMTDAPVCPDQQRVSSTIVKLLKRFHLPGILGIRIYGRRAGQKRPLWSYGVDWGSRNRLVPEPAPEFAATDVYVADLVAQSSDEILRSELTPADLRDAWKTFREKLGQKMQMALVRSQLFAPLPENQTLVSPAPEESALSRYTPSHYQGAKVALIWGTIGILLTFQGDRLLHHLKERQSVTQVVSPPVVAVPLPETSPDTTTPISPVLTDEDTFIEETPLAEAPANASALAAESPFPTFNSEQLDQKVALYHQLTLDSGPTDVLIVGSSRALRGVDPVVLKQELEKLGYTDVSVFNYGVNGATAQVIDLIVRRILTPDQLPRLIIWADGARAFNSSTLDVTYNGVVLSEGYRAIVQENPNLSAEETQLSETEMPGVAGTEGFGASLTASYQEIDGWLSDRLASMSAAHTDRDRLKAMVQQGLTAWLPEPSPIVPTGEDPNDPQSLANAGQGLIDVNGFLPLAVRFNPATYYQQYARVAGAYDSDYKDFQIEGKQAIALQNLLNYTRSHNVPVVFVNLPLTDDYLDPVRLQHEQEFRQYMLNVSLTQQGLIFRDLGEQWVDRYTYFSDPSHLNRYGAQAVSTRLAQDPMIPWLP